MGAIPPTGPVPMGGVSQIWQISPSLNLPAGGSMKLTPSVYSPSVQVNDPTNPYGPTWQAQPTSVNPLGRFRGLSWGYLNVITTQGSYSVPKSLTYKYILVSGGGNGGNASGPKGQPTGSYGNFAGGGGGGLVVPGTTPLTAGSPFPVFVGSGIQNYNYTTGTQAFGWTLVPGGGGSQVNNVNGSTGSYVSGPSGPAGVSAWQGGVGGSSTNGQSTGGLPLSSQTPLGNFYGGAASSGQYAGGGGGATQQATGGPFNIGAGGTGLLFNPPVTGAYYYLSYGGGGAGVTPYTSGGGVPGATGTGTAGQAGQAAYTGVSSGLYWYFGGGGGGARSDTATSTVYTGGGGAPGCAIIYYP